MNKNVNILDYFKQDKKYQEIIEAINGNVKNIQINNASTNASKMLIASKFLEKEETIVVVYPNIFYANRAYEDYIELIGADKISFFQYIQQKELWKFNLHLRKAEYHFNNHSFFHKLFLHFPKSILG